MTGKVIDIRSRMRSKDGNPVLLIDHARGKVSASTPPGYHRSEEFGDRMARIKASLEKINRLMSELKQLSEAQTRSNKHVLDDER